MMTLEHSVINSIENGGMSDLRFRLILNEDDYLLVMSYPEGASSITIRFDATRFLSSKNFHSETKDNGGSVIKLLLAWGRPELDHSVDKDDPPLWATKEFEVKFKLPGDYSWNANEIVREVVVGVERVMFRLESQLPFPVGHYKKTTDIIYKKTNTESDAGS